MAATPEERGRALVDLLLLADALPHGGRRGKPSTSRRLDSTARDRAASAQAVDEAPSLPDKVIAIHEALRAAKIPHALGGALALAYYATPRATIDIDLNVFVPAERWQDVIDALDPLGIATGRLDSAALERDGQCRLWWGDNAVDLFFSYDPIHEEMRKQARRVPFGGDHRADPRARAPRRLQGDVRPAARTGSTSSRC